MTTVVGGREMDRIRRDGLIRIRELDIDFGPPWGRRQMSRVDYGPLADALDYGVSAEYEVPPDPNAKDGEWHAVVRLEHEIVEWEGRAVPLFEGDVERREWEARRAQR